MGYDLYNKKDKKDYYRWTVSWWKPVLDLAVKYGWEPKGTIEPDYWKEKPSNPKWGGFYNWNSGETVTVEDAKNLAEALKKAVEAGTDTLVVSDQKGLEDFIKFCERGAFEIY